MLETPEGLMRSEVAACHAQLTLPAKEPQGQKNTQNLAALESGGRFFGQVHLGTAWPVGEALLGAWRWDEPTVVESVRVLLCNGQGGAAALVTSVRARLCLCYFNCFFDMLRLERAAYGAESYVTKAGIDVDALRASSQTLLDWLLEHGNL